MFAYCGNNPVNSADPSGNRPIWEQFEGGNVGYTDSGTVSIGPDRPSAHSISMRNKAMGCRDKYSTEDWASLTSEEKINFAQNYLSELQEILGISGYTVQFIDFPEWLYGRTMRVNKRDNTNKIILINSNYLSPEFVLQTVAHEAYHAYQYELINGTIPCYELPGTLAIWRNELVGGHYIDGAVSFKRYYSQYSEISANWFANKLNTDKILQPIGCGYYN